MNITKFNLTNKQKLAQPNEVLFWPENKVA
jgi:hypothetical protein